MQMMIHSNPARLEMYRSRASGSHYRYLYQARQLGRLGCGRTIHYTFYTSQRSQDTSNKIFLGQCIVQPAFAAACSRAAAAPGSGLPSMSMPFWPQVGGRITPYRPSRLSWFTGDDPPLARSAQTCLAARAGRRACVQPPACGTPAAAETVPPLDDVDNAAFAGRQAAPGNRGDHTHRSACWVRGAV